MRGPVAGDGVSRIEELQAEFEAEWATEDADDRTIGDHDVRVNVTVDGVRRYRCRCCGMVRTGTVYDFETRPCAPDESTDDHDRRLVADWRDAPDASVAPDGGGPDTPALVALDRVHDRDADPEDRSVAVVVEHAGTRADEHPIDALDGSPTVAALNPEHSADAPVVVVALEGDLDRHASGWRSVPRGELADRLSATDVSVYAYPVTRLEKVELATDGGRVPARDEERLSGRSTPSTPANNVFYNPGGRATRKARNTTDGRNGGSAPVPSKTTGISASPSSSAAAGRRLAWVRGPERLDHATNDPGGTMKTTRHHDHETDSTDALNHGERDGAGSRLAPDGEPGMTPPIGTRPPGVLRRGRTSSGTRTRTPKHSVRIPIKRPIDIFAGDKHETAHRRGDTPLTETAQGRPRLIIRLVRHRASNSAVFGGFRYWRDCYVPGERLDRHFRSVSRRGDLVTRNRRWGA